jgi:hypothetical protein
MTTEVLVWFEVETKRLRTQAADKGVLSCRYICDVSDVIGGVPRKPRAVQTEHALQIVVRHNVLFLGVDTAREIEFGRSQ